MSTNNTEEEGFEVVLCRPCPEPHREIQQDETKFKGVTQADTVWSGPAGQQAVELTLTNGESLNIREFGVSIESVR